MPSSSFFANFDNFNGWKVSHITASSDVSCNPIDFSASGPQLWSVACADSAESTVAAQLPRSFSPSAEREPGSAAYVKIVSP